MTVRIVTDSACDLPAATVEQHGITVVPLTIRFGDEEFVDREQLTTAEFWARCATSPVLPSTAAPAPGRFEVEYRRLIADGATGIVVITLSSALSATMQSAQLAAEAVAQTPGGVPIEVVDTRSVTLGEGMIAIAAAQRAAEGASVAEVAALARDLSTRTHVWGTLDTLENLKKGGRIGGAKAFLATALAIKPIIECRDGVVAEGGKQRTRAKALAFLADKVRQAKGIERLAVMHADCSDVDLFLDMLRPYAPGEILVGDIGAVVGTHAGRGTMGVIFQTTA